MTKFGKKQFNKAANVKGKGQRNEQSQQSVHGYAQQLVQKNLENQQLQKTRQAKLNLFDELLLEYLRITNQEIIPKRENHALAVQPNRLARETNVENTLGRQEPRVQKQRRDPPRNPEPETRPRSPPSVSPTRSEKLEFSLDELVRMDKTRNKQRKQERYEREYTGANRYHQSQTTITNRERRTRHHESEPVRQTRDRSRTPPRSRVMERRTETPERLNYTIHSGDESF